MYTPHPSHELTELFVEKPYQGAAPEAAAFLFVGLDANYHPSIAETPIFRRILDYHRNGVAFWREHGVHHPFLLPEYRGDGRRYHRSFSRIGFRAEHAEQVSFAELLHVPTVGRSDLTVDDLSLPHLQWLDVAIREGAARHIFLPAKVARLMRESGMFPWLATTPVAQRGPLAVLYSDAHKTVYLHLHFSVYGKFEKRKAEELAFIGTLVPSGIPRNGGRSEAEPGIKGRIKRSF